jgi:ribose transport system substrate-binding protein
MTEPKRVIDLRVITLVLSVVALLLVGLTAGCGGDDDGDEPTGAAGGAGVAEAREIVAEAEKPLQFEFEGPSFDATEARGKDVWFIGISLQVPQVHAWLAGTEAGLGTVGVNVTAFDGKGQVAEMNRGIQQAIAANADAIIIGSGQIESLSASIARAESAGIPVINGEGGEPVIPRDVPGVVAEANHDFEEIGRLVGAWAVADAGGPVNALVIESTDTAPSKPYVRGITETIERLAPESSVSVENVPVAQWETRLPTLTRTAVQGDPELDYLLPLYDGMILAMLPALQLAGAEDRVRIGTANATPAVLENLEEGTALKADVFTTPEWLGWASADQALRAMTGTPPVRDERIPLGLATENNIDEIDIQGPESTQYPDVDLKDDYGKVWGVAE